MAEEKTVVNEEEKKAWKDSLPAKWAKVLASSGAAIGASAIVTVLLKQGDLSGIKGYKKLLVPIGIFGISAFASRSASKAVEGEIDDTLDAMDALKKLAKFIANNKITKMSVTPSDNGQVTINMDGESK
jgi:hypothetical protein